MNSQYYQFITKDFVPVSYLLSVL